MATAKNLQKQYDLIYHYFKSTTEPFDTLNWDGTKVILILNDKIIEKYSKRGLKQLIPNL